MKQTETIHITPAILSLISEIDEFKGAWRASEASYADWSEGWKREAVEEAAGSSAMIETWLMAWLMESPDSVEAVRDPHSGVRETGSFSSVTRGEGDQQEAGAYRAVVAEILQSWQTAEFTEDLYADLQVRLVKSTKNRALTGVREQDSAGSALISKLMLWVRETLHQKKMHPLFVSAIFFILFLEVQPLREGYGRLCLILTKFLLLQAGYGYVACIPLEQGIVQHGEDFIRAIKATRESLSRDEPDWEPWILFFLKMLEGQMKIFSLKVEKKNQESREATLLPVVSSKILQYAREHERVRIGELSRSAGISRNTLKVYFRRLAAERLIDLHGAGRGAWYTLSERGKRHAAGC